MLEEDIMQCLNCGKEFTSVRNTAKFDSEKCKKQYQRLAGQSNSLSGTDSLAGQVSGTENETLKDKSDKGLPEEEKGTTDFIPNWKRKGYSSSKEGILAAMALLAANPNLEGEVFHIDHKSFEVKGKKMVRIA